jgi:transglutaminase-like putative cysteine protease
MILEITHITDYTYGHPAAEAYGEARLTPPTLPGQTVLSHSIEIDPVTRVSSYTDFFGNSVQFFSLPYRHKKLVVTNRAVVETHAVPLPAASLELSVEEARQIFSSAMPDIFAYLQATDIVPLGQESIPWVRKFLRGDISLGEGLRLLNEAINDTFDYEKGATDTSTTLKEVWRTRRGVCQDYAHIGLSVLRTAGLPARYVCGYIESGGGNGSRSPGLTGALATHAWIEVLVPGMRWVAFDPTNRKWCTDQYVAVSFGRDFRDATPLRGTFKGSGGQAMKVKVYVKRRNGKK